MSATTQIRKGATTDMNKPSILPRLLLRCELWVHARILPFQAWGKSLEETLTLAQPNPLMSHYKNLSPDYIARAVRRTTRRPWIMRDRRCLRQGLLTYRYLVHNGLQPQLHFGVSDDVVTSEKVAAHCWVTLDGKILIGESEISYVEVLVHPSEKAA